MQSYGVALALAVGFGLPLAVAFASHAQARAASTALESIAKQPEAAGRVQTAMIIALALIESLVIYALLAFFLMNGKLQSVTEVQEATKDTNIYMSTSGARVTGTTTRR